jgi:hypothetical protein
MTATAARPAPAAPAAPAAPSAPPAERWTAPAAWTRLAPTLVAAALAAAYVIVAPPSIDLAAHLFRAQLFARNGFVLWNNAWYGGHDTPGYSVLFPAVSAALTPQVAAALASVASAALFETLAVRHYRRRAWLGALLFGAATGINLYTGRLALAFGALPALGAIVLLDRRRTGPACLLAALAALCSPVAALFAALAAAGCALAAVAADRRPGAALPATSVALAALAPIGALAVAFPEGGTEPFGLATLLPLVVIAVAALLLLPRTAARLRAGIAVYLVAALACFLIPSPVGSNIARLGTFLAAPLAALIWWRRRPALLAIAILPLLYIAWQAPVRDVTTTAGDPSVSAGYYRPLLRYLHRQPGVFRLEIPLTRSHWEAYWVARAYPLARGWERQLDIRDNQLFYDGRLTPSAYAGWLHENAIRFVALPDAALDYSAQREASLIRAGLPYLRLVMRSRHWRVYAVANPTPLASGPATVTAMSAAALTLTARATGTTLVRVRYSPYWALTRGTGCVAPAGAFTRVTLARPGPVRLAIRFSPARIGARTPRCTASG